MNALKPHIKLKCKEWTVPIYGPKGYPDGNHPPHDLWYQAYCWCKRYSQTEQARRFGVFVRYSYE